MAKASVQAMGEKSRPSTRCRVNIGSRARTMMKMVKKICFWTWPAARTITGPMPQPASLRRAAEMARVKASTMTTVESTMMPKSMAPSESKLAGMPRRYMTMKAKTRAKGMARAEMRAARHEPSRMVRRTMTMSMPSSSVRATVWTVSRTSSVRS